MLSIFTLGFLAAASFTAAQDQPQFDYPYTIDPESVPIFLREHWCESNEAQCPLICLQLDDVTSMNTIQNDCDPEALTYTCVCENNMTPNVTEYQQTLPYFICTEWGNQCERDCGNDASCATDCRQNHICAPKGAVEQKTNTTKSVSSTASASETASKTSAIATEGFGGAPATGTANSEDKGGAASAMLNLGQSFGMAIVLGGLVAGFAIGL